MPLPESKAKAGKPFCRMKSVGGGKVIRFCVSGKKATKAKSERNAKNKSGGTKRFGKRGTKASKPTGSIKYTNKKKTKAVKIAGGATVKRTQRKKKTSVVKQLASGGKKKVAKRKAVKKKAVKKKAVVKKTRATAETKTGGGDPALRRATRKTRKPTKKKTATKKTATKKPFVSRKEKQRPSKKRIQKAKATSFKAKPKPKKKVVVKKTATKDLALSRATRKGARPSKKRKDNTKFPKVKTIKEKRSNREWRKFLKPKPEDPFWGPYRKKWNIINKKWGDGQQWERGRSSGPSVSDSPYGGRRMINPQRWREEIYLLNHPHESRTSMYETWEAEDEYEREDRQKEKAKEKKKAKAKVVAKKAKPETKEEEDDDWRSRMVVPSSATTTADIAVFDSDYEDTDSGFQSFDADASDFSFSDDDDY